MANQNNESTQNKPANGKDINPAFGNIDSVTGGGGIEKAKDTARTLVDQAKSAAGDAYESVAEKATSTIEEKKAGFTGGLTSVADSIRKVGDDLNQAGEKTPVSEYTARYSQTAAQKLEDVAHYFETKDLRSVARDLEGYARRNPAVFLGGAFALGILAARFFKSSPTPSVGYGMAAPDRQLPRADFGQERKDDIGEGQSRGATPGTF